MFKRLLFVVALVPVGFLSVIWWIFTGDNIFETFMDWSGM